MKPDIVKKGFGRIEGRKEQWENWRQRRVGHVDISESPFAVGSLKADRNMNKVRRGGLLEEGAKRN